MEKVQSLFKSEKNKSFTISFKDTKKQNTKFFVHVKIHRNFVQRI